MLYNASEFRSNGGQQLDVASAPAPTKSRKSISPTVREILADRETDHPVWVRAPKTGPERYSGFSRAKLYDLAGRGLIRSVSIREPGQTRGTRLFNLSSILEFIDRCEAEASKHSALVDSEGWPMAEGLGKKTPLMATA